MNPESPQPHDPPASATPGKIRTWWHPLLASLLRWQLGSHYHLQEEVPVGQKPLQIDILLLHKEQGELPESARRILAGLAEYLNEFTMLEFKSPSDTLRAGDFQTFLAYTLLYRAQNDPLLDPGQLNLLVVAPRLTKPYREELQTLSVTVEQEEHGIWRLQGGPVVHRTWVLETEKLAGLEHPLLTVVSPRFRQDGENTYDMLSQGGYDKMVKYMGQQIKQFRLLGKEFAMQHLGAEDEMQQAWRDFLASLSLEERLEGLSPEERRDFLASLPPEERRDLLASLPPEELHDFLASLPPEERLEGLPAEKRVEGLSLEERLRGLSPEELERLRQLVQTQTKTDTSSRPE